VLWSLCPYLETCLLRVNVKEKLKQFLNKQYAIFVKFVGDKNRLKMLSSLTMGCKQYKYELSMYMFAFDYNKQYACMNSEKFHFNCCLRIVSSTKWPFQYHCGYRRKCEGGLANKLKVSFDRILRWAVRGCWCQFYREVHQFTTLRELPIIGDPSNQIESTTENNWTELTEKRADWHSTGLHSPTWGQTASLNPSEMACRNSPRQQ